MEAAVERPHGGPSHPAEEIPVSRHQQDEEFHRDFFEPEGLASSAQLITSRIKLEIRESDFRDRYLSTQIHENIASESPGPKSNRVFSANCSFTNRQCSGSRRLIFIEGEAAFSL